MLADEQCALLPVVLLLVDRKRKVPLVCMFAVAVAGVARLYPANYVIALVSARFVRFLRLLVLPWGFTVAPPEMREPLWLGVTLTVAMAAAAVWGWRKRSAYAELKWLLAGYVLLIPSFSAHPASDPRMYLPMFAFAAAAALLLARIPMRHVATGLVAILLALSIGRTYVWASDERLWREAVRRAPDEVEPKIQLAKSLRAADALELLGRARQLAPYNPEIPAEIGKVFLDEQQYDAAVDELSHAVALNPANALAFNNRGVALAALGQTAAAAADFGHALSLDPDLAEARENLKRLGAR
jgi:tetratricopeptide (TPR) repeat protein